MRYTEDTSTVKELNRHGARRSGPTEVNTKGNGKMGRRVVKEDSGMLTVTLMKVNGFKTRQMVTVYIFTQTELNI